MLRGFLEVAGHNDAGPERNDQAKNKCLRKDGEVRLFLAVAPRHLRQV